MDTGPSLPHLSAPHDVMRYGLSALKEDVSAAHPVETVMKQMARQHEEAKRLLLQKAYGSAFSMKMDIEKQILSRIQRLPGLPSSMVALDSYTGDLDDFSFSDYVGDPQYSEAMGGNLGIHDHMEIKLGLSTGPSSARPQL